MVRFKRSHGFAYLIGSTRSGKTCYLLSKLNNANEWLDVVPTEIIYCYSIWQSKFETLRNVRFHKGLPTSDMLDSLSGPTVIVLDDLLDMLAKGQGARLLEALFTRLAHHGAQEHGISVFLVCQDLFYCNSLKVARRNASAYWLFRSPGDTSAVAELSRRIYPKCKDFLVDAHEDAIRERYGCLFIDLSADCDPSLRVRAENCPVPYVYMPPNP